MYQCRCMAKNSWWWAERLPETCRVVITNKIGIQYVCWFHSLGIFHGARSYELKTTYIVWEDIKFRACLDCAILLSASVLPKYCRYYLQHISKVLLSSTWSLKCRVGVAVTRTSQPHPNGTQNYNVYRPPHLKELNLAWADGTFCSFGKSGRHIKRQ